MLNGNHHKLDLLHEKLDLFERELILAMAAAQKLASRRSRPDNKNKLLQIAASLCDSFSWKVALFKRQRAASEVR
jgi:hypothetical protein